MQGTGMSSSRAVVNLNGDWERYVHDKLVGIVPVPSSLAPGGVYSLRREFLLPRLANRKEPSFTSTQFFITVAFR